MITTMNAAFKYFLKEKVRLITDRTEIARKSRDWLINEISKFPDDQTFLRFHEDLSIEFGSFNRKTKIRPLDDIDIMIILHAQGGTYEGSNETINIYNSGNSKYFLELQNEGTQELNSIKVINKFKEKLAQIAQYKSAEIKRNQEAVTLSLTSYEWNFDIVPCFITSDEYDGRSYFLIPDGKGKWKKTDPRIDKANIQHAQTLQIVSVLDIIRLMKFWNRISKMPSIPSYQLEVMILNCMKSTQLENRIDYAIEKCLYFIATNIDNPVYDPKKIQGDINALSNEERQKIKLQAITDYNHSLQAKNYGLQNNIKESLKKWGEVFGTEFPIYTPQLQINA